MFYLEEKSHIKYYKSTLIDDLGLTYAFTTRYSDILGLPYKGFSLAKGGFENQESIISKNRKEICNILECDFNNLIIPDQKHTDNIKIVTSMQDDVTETDALITNKSNLVLMLLFADCTPIILYNSEEKVVAVVHAGWRGTAKKIAPKTINKMCDFFNLNKKSIKALIGAAIGQCCYPVNLEVAEELEKSFDKKHANIFIKSVESDKINVDLKALNSQQIRESGITSIDILDECTCCNVSAFFSHRAEKGITGRHGAIASLR